MNIKQRMNYHARQYRRLKALDAGSGLEEVKRAERVGHAQLNELERYYGYVNNAKRELEGTITWLQDLAKAATEPEVKKLATQFHATLSKNYRFISNSR